MAKTESNPNNYCRELVKYVTAYLPKGRPRSYETVLGGHGLHQLSRNQQPWLGRQKAGKQAQKEEGRDVFTGNFLICLVFFLTVQIYCYSNS